MEFKLWFLMLLALQDVNFGSTTTQETGLQTRRRCHLCNGVACKPKTSALCPPEAPLCATFAESPNFHSSLTCSAVSSTPCVITFIGQHDVKMKCICDQDLCNEPFSDILRSNLLNATEHAANYSTEELTNLIEYSIRTSPNITNLHKYFSVQIIHSLEDTFKNAKLEPRAEALKHDATPSDDDEDESDGSGAYDEPKTKIVPSPPAKPSSYLPAKESKAEQLFINFLATIPLLVLMMA